MSTFGLVHGGKFGAWYWEPVIAELTAQGHNTLTVDLTFDDFDAGAARCADRTAAAFTKGFSAALTAGHGSGTPPFEQSQEMIQEIIIVGHATAGLFLPLLPSRLLGSPLVASRLVFLHTLLPQPGRSLADQMSEEPNILARQAFVARGPFARDEAGTIRQLFGDCEPDVAAAAFRKLQPESSTLSTETFPLPAWPETGCAYIVCTKDPIVNPNWARQAARDRLGVVPLELAAGHCPMLSRPRELTDLLIAAGRGN